MSGVTVVVKTAKWFTRGALVALEHRSSAGSGSPARAANHPFVGISDILNIGRRSSVSTAVSGKLGKRGTLVIPAELRRRYGLREGSMFIAEATDQGILIKPAVAVPVEVYTPERKAEFLLSTAVDEADYVAARAVVEELGLDPDAIEHHRP